MSATAWASIGASGGMTGSCIPTWSAYRRRVARPSGRGAATSDRLYVAARPQAGHHVGMTLETIPSALDTERARAVQVLAARSQALATARRDGDTDVVDRMDLMLAVDAAEAVLRRLDARAG